MCTVSFFRDHNSTIITSSRDEAMDRPLALMPVQVVYKDFILYYPLDPKGNGTWFAARNDGGVFVLLNGAAHRHIPEPPYRKSRGLVHLDFVKAPDFLIECNAVNLLQIEPFTLVAWTKRGLFQFRWDGSRKTLSQLDSRKAWIWSSSTLYAPDVVLEREQWFSDFLESKKDQLNADALLSFHLNTKRDDNYNGLVINRNNSMVTKNITQCVLGKELFTLTHHDLLTNQQSYFTGIIR